MSFLDEALKTAAQVAATAVGGPLAGLAAKELVEEALEEEKKEDDEPKQSLQP
jgi:ribosomal protein L12E/L44/L45/RPP1/RPP2